MHVIWGALIKPLTKQEYNTNYTIMSLKEDRNLSMLSPSNKHYRAADDPIQYII